MQIAVTFVERLRPDGAVVRVREEHSVRSRVRAGWIRGRVSRSYRAGTPGAGEEETYA